MSYPSTTTLRFSEAAGSTLKLLVYLGVAVLLMASDHRGDWLGQVRQKASLLAGPLYWVAGLPGRLGGAVQDNIASRQVLVEENARLREGLLLANARIHRMEAVAQENDRLRELLGGTRGLQLSVQLASILDVDLDPFRHRILVDVGTRDGVQAGQAMIDAGGVVGQIIDVTARRSTALLVTDPDHALPVQVVRSGLRLIAYGTGERDRLAVPNIPLSGDIRAGDALVTSGIGGRYPAGFPVGTVIEVGPDPTRLFAEASVRPAAALERRGEVLLVWNAQVDADVGPPGPEDVQP